MQVLNPLKRKLEVYFKLLYQNDTECGSALGAKAAGGTTTYSTRRNLHYWELSNCK